MIQPGNWREARDAVRELEGHVIQSGNWRVARDPARELEGTRSAFCRSLISAKHRKPIIQKKKCGTDLVPGKSTGTGPEPEFRSDPNPDEYIPMLIICIRKVKIDPTKTSCYLVTK